MQKDSAIIISLTSFPERVGGLHLTVHSVLNQTVQADLIVIWLAASQFPNGMDDIPPSLKRLLSDKCLIRWCSDMRSYKKLIPALVEYPNATIVTIDDDIIYERTLIEKLLHGHELHPGCIVASRVTKFHSYNGVLFDDDGGYSYWKQPSFLNKLVGCGGCLYPPKSLDPNVLDYEMARALAPTSDDIWFWLMGVKAGTRVYRIADGDWYPKRNTVNSGLNPLSRVNDVEGGYFYIHLDNILNAFPQIRKRLLLEGENDPISELIDKAEHNIKCSNEGSGLVGKSRVMQVDETRLFGLLRNAVSGLLSSARRLPGLKWLYIRYLESKNTRTVYSRYINRRCDNGLSYKDIIQ